MHSLPLSMVTRTRSDGPDEAADANILYFNISARIKLWVFMMIYTVIIIFWALMDSAKLHH